MKIRKASTALIMLAASVAAVHAQMPPVRVTVGKAKMIDAPASMTLVGTVYPLRASTVASEVPGIAKDMPARQGDRVEAGGLICKLNDDVLSYRLAEERSELKRLRAQHEELLAGTRKERLARLEAVRDEAVAEFERWRFEMERIRRLFESGDSNEKEFEDTRASYLAAQRRKIAADAEYDEAVAGPRVERIAQAAHEVTAQQAVVNRLESDLGKTSIRAPFVGYVSRRLTEVGEWVQVGGDVVELVDLSSVLVRADAPESVLAFLVRGADARVWIDALGRSFDGRVKHVIPSADLSARTFPVEVEVANESGLLAAGQFARVTVAAGPDERVVAVPKDAIVERDGISSVGLLVPGRDGQWKGVLTPVAVGLDVADWITITSENIEPGMTVVVRGTERIMPFPSPVIVVDENGTPVDMPPPPSRGGATGGDRSEQAEARPGAGAGTEHESD